MFIHNRLFGSGAMLAALLFTGAAAVGDEPGFGAPIMASVDHLMADGAPGVVVLRKDGDQVTSLATGVSNLDGQIAMTTEERFRAGSLVKTYVATVMLQLVAEGRVELDDSVETFLPGVVPNGRFSGVSRSHRAGLLRLAK